MGQVAVKCVAQQLILQAEHRFLHRSSDIETLGEAVRDRVKENSGVELEWEIKRIGVAK